MPALEINREQKFSLDVLPVRIRDFRGNGRSCAERRSRNSCEKNKNQNDQDRR